MCRPSAICLVYSVLSVQILHTCYSDSCSESSISVLSASIDWTYWKNSRAHCDSEMKCDWLMWGCSLIGSSTELRWCHLWSLAIWSSWARPPEETSQGRVQSQAPRCEPRVRSACWRCSVTHGTRSVGSNDSLERSAMAGVSYWSSLYILDLLGGNTHITYNI